MKPTPRLPVLALLTLSVAAEAQPPDAAFTPPGPNVAQDRPYTLNVRPNYALCTDPDDRTQLTDGIYSQGYFWVQKTTVGWQRTTPVQITIDLGEVLPVAGVSYSTAAGVAGVSWPSSILIFVSEDAQSWTLLGDLVQLGAKEVPPPADGYSQFRFATDELRARGRYVQLAVDGAPYLFVDEIEVYRGPDAYLAEPPKGRVVTDLPAYLVGARVNSARLWRLRTDLNHARAAVADAPLDDAVKTALRARADALSREIDALPDTVPPGFRTVLPFSDLHARVYALHAPVLRARGLPSLSVWQANRWDPLKPTESPTTADLSANTQVVFDAMRNEVRSEVLNLTNAADEQATVGLSVEGLDGAVAQSLTVREVLHTDTKDRVPLAAALPEATRHGTGWEVNVPAGCTRQVWFSFHPQGVAPGTYSGTIRFTGPALDHAVPLRLTVYPLTMPAERHTFIGGWDYTNGRGAYDACPTNLPALIALLKEYGVNTPWANSGVRPAGAQFNAEGRLTAPLDFASFDEWVGRWPDAKRYCVFLSVGETFEGETRGTPRFDTMVGEYFRAWVTHLRERRVDPRKLAVLLRDEPHDADAAGLIIDWARAIEAATPEVVIWEDPTYRDPTAMPKGLLEVCEVLCPNLPMFRGFSPEARKVYTDQREAGKELWFYSCSGPGKRLDPYNYHRGQFWWALRYGAVGSHYWAFGDEGGSGTSWNAYRQTRNQYSPLFLDAASVTPGKHLEAIREGAEDFEYFVLLREQIAKSERTGQNAPALAAARTLLATGPARVVDQLEGAGLGWDEEFDRTQMDTVRVELLRVLSELSAG